MALSNLSQRHVPDDKKAKETFKPRGLFGKPERTCLHNINSREKIGRWTDRQTPTSNSFMLSQDQVFDREVLKSLILFGIVTFHTEQAQ